MNWVRGGSSVRPRGHDQEKWHICVVKSCRVACQLPPQAIEPVATLGAKNVELCWVRVCVSNPASHSEKLEAFMMGDLGAGRESTRALELRW